MIVPPTTARVSASTASRHTVHSPMKALRVPLIVAQIGGGSAQERNPTGRVSDSPPTHRYRPTIGELLQWSPSSELPVARSWPRTVPKHRRATSEAMTPMVARAGPRSQDHHRSEKYIDLPVESCTTWRPTRRKRTNLVAKNPERTRARSPNAQVGAQLPGPHGPRMRRFASGFVHLVTSLDPRRAGGLHRRDDPENLVDVERLMMEGIELTGSVARPTRQTPTAR